MSAYLLISKSGGHPVTDINFNMWEQSLILVSHRGYKQHTDIDKIVKHCKNKEDNYLDSVTFMSRVTLHFGIPRKYTSIYIIIS